MAKSNLHFTPYFNQIKSINLIVLIIRASFEAKMGLDDDEQQAPSMQSSSIKSLDVEELEMILEAYFVQIEGTLNKLSAVRLLHSNIKNVRNVVFGNDTNLDEFFR